VLEVLSPCSITDPPRVAAFAVVAALVVGTRFVIGLLFLAIDSQKLAGQVNPTYLVVVAEENVGFVGAAVVS